MLPLLAESGSLDADRLEHWGTLVVVGILALGHILRLIATEIGWPGWIVRLGEKNRRRETQLTLEELGLLDVADAARRKKFSEGLASATKAANEQQRAVTLLQTAMCPGPHTVGTNNKVKLEYFVDVMSSSLNPKYARNAATCLVSALAKRPAGEGEDVVVGLKHGSPLFAAAVAEALGLPLVLFRGPSDQKFESANPSAPLFDGTLPVGKRALIVDDSTMSGRMVIECAQAVRSAQLEVTRCAVLFLPVGKNPAGELKTNGLELISVVELNKRTLSKIQKLAP